MLSRLTQVAEAVVAMEQTKRSCCRQRPTTRPGHGRVDSMADAVVQIQ